MASNSSITHAMLAWLADNGGSITPKRNGDTRTWEVKVSWGTPPHVQHISGFGTSVEQATTDAVVKWYRHTQRASA